MQATGLLRRIDNHGVINIPKTIRETLGLQIGDTIEFFIDRHDNSLICKKAFTTVDSLMISFSSLNDEEKQEFLKKAIDNWNET